MSEHPRDAVAIRTGLTGIILAGGASHRMGTDKAFLDVGGVPMIQRVVDALRSVCAEVLVVAKLPDAYRHLAVRVVPDDDARQAPLVGICAGLRAVTVPYAFVAACDLPFLSAAAVSLLAGLAAGYDAVVPQVDETLHALHAVYATAARGALEAGLESGDLRLADMLSALRVRAVSAAELAQADPHLATLRNVNTPEDYEGAIREALEAEAHKEAR